MADRTPPGFKTKDEILSRRQPNREAVEASKREALLEIGLHELRERTGVTQTAIAERMETSRPNVHRIEHEDDIRLSTLERYVRAAGGVLRIDAVMPDGESITLLGSAGEAVTERPKGRRSA
jgi:DNA-binding XRE family transcriptional regulator